MRISIIGAGKVGGAIAYTLMIGGIQEIVLVDIDRDRACGEAQDLREGIPVLPFFPKIYAGDFSKISSSHIVIITAGEKRRPSDSRLDLLRNNARIMKQVIEKVVEYNRSCIIFIVSNPVDVLTYLALNQSGFSERRVFGLGTFLDTIRFKSALSEEVEVNPSELHALIIGEHGDSMVPVWSQTRIFGIPLCEYKRLDKAKMDEILKKTRNAGAEAILKKGGACFSVALAVSEVIWSIVLDRKKIIPVTSLLNGYYGISDVCLSVPTLIGKEGAEELIKIPLSREEKEGLRYSGSILKEKIGQLELNG
ncbi:MAG: L-lactate dehydrogenase [bacterium]|nr:L-lactate dehydrogenase [bacterium]